jgi:Fe-S-cluster-containing hydrogenase component 2
VQRGAFTYRAVQKPVVIKCDLCAHREAGPACVSACLTNALAYLDEDAVEKLTRKKQREAVEAVELASSIA